MAPIEFQLAVECCRWAFDKCRASAIRSAAGHVRWADFLLVADRHRVAGLAWHAIHSLGIPIPEGDGQTLKAKSEEIAAHGLRAAAESLRLSKLLDDASIPHIFVKGLAVGALAYESPFLKQSWDIDLLVSEGQIAQCAGLLDWLGYELIQPRLAGDWGRLERWHETQKDSAWRHRSSAIIVELHSRLADNRLLIPNIGLDSPVRQVPVTEKITLPTLATDEMFAHLCVHGASSLWFRLKWIADLAALLGREPADIGHLYRRSQQLGAGRSAGQALLLARQLFDLAIEERLIRMLRSDAPTRWLTKAAIDQLLAPEPGGRKLDTATIHATQLLLLPSLGFKLSEARRQAVAALSNLRH